MDKHPQSDGEWLKFIAVTAMNLDLSWSKNLLTLPKSTCVREKRRDSLRHNSYAALSRPLAVLAMRDTRSQSLFLCSYGVIYWRDICRRVVIETTHLRAAKWPLPAVPESGAINFPSPLARPAFNLTGQASLHSLAVGPRGNRVLTSLECGARFWSTLNPGDLLTLRFLPQNFHSAINIVLNTVDSVLTSQIFIERKTIE